MYGVSMQAGLLNRQIEVYKPVTLTNNVGATTIKWTKAFETRANVRQTGMSRGQQVNEIFYPTTKEFIIRSYHHIDEFHRIKYQNNMYRIVSIERRREMNDILIIADLVNE
jgi:head-tail adaptor